MYVYVYVRLYCCIGNYNIYILWYYYIMILLYYVLLIKILFKLSPSKRKTLSYLKENEHWHFFYYLKVKERRHSYRNKSLIWVEYSDKLHAEYSRIHMKRFLKNNKDYEIRIIFVFLQYSTFEVHLVYISLSFGWLFGCGRNSPKIIV